MARRPPRPEVNGRRRRSWRARRDWGGMVARVLCALFALVGVIPLAAGALIRIDRVQAWAAEKTAALISAQLELDASYELELRPWPLMLSMEDVVLHASDGGPPFLEARRVVARPRLFWLLAGRIDLGAVEIEEPRLRAVIEDGKLRNLHYRLPETSSDGTVEDLPISSVSFTNGFVDVTVDGTNLRSEEIDVDVNIRRSAAGSRALLARHALDVALRAGATAVDRMHPSASVPGVDDIDEDALCRVELRATIDAGVSVRRLSLRGAADLDPAPGTRPPCQLEPDDWRNLEVTLEGVEVHFDAEQTPDSFDGRLLVRTPAGIAHRFVPLPPTAGWVELRLEELHYQRGARLPDLRGSLRGASLGIDTKMAARSIAAQIHTEDQALVATDVDVGWGGGRATIPEATISPFAEGVPLEARDIVVRGVRLRELLDDVSVHPNAHVDWHIATARVERFGGTLAPLGLSGPMIAETEDFAVYDRPAIEPHKRRMMGVERGALSGTFRVTPEGVQLAGYTVITPRSKVFATVSIGFDDAFGLNVGEGSMVDLDDISPLVDIPIHGKARVTARGYGTTADPAVEGELDIDGFHFGGFPLGNVEHAKAKFVPLDLAISEARLVHGKSAVDVPRLDIDFDDQDADVVLDGTMDATAGGLHLRDFFEMVQLLPEGEAGAALCQAMAGGADRALPLLAGRKDPSDPTWCTVNGVAHGVADFHYLLGGRRDRCGGGQLDVRTRMQIAGLALFGLRYEDAELDATLRWHDMEAGDRGMALDLHSGVLRKGSGTIVGSGTVRHGAKLAADVVGTAIPLEEIEAFRKAFGLQTDDQRAERNVAPEARVSFVARVGGTLDRLSGNADIDLSEMRIGPDRLPASRFALEIVPTAEPVKVLRHTRCGNAITPPFDPRRMVSNEWQGVYRIRGQLFGGQVELRDVEITQQREAMLSGEVAARDLDLGTFANLLPDVAFSRSPPDGRLSAVVFIDEVPLDRPGLAEMRIKIEGAEITKSGNTLTIPAIAQPLLLSGDALRIPPVPIELRTRSGLRAHLTGQGSIGHLSKKPELDVSIDIEPIDLATLGVDIPQIQRAAGVLEGRLAIKGSIDNPDLDGRIELDHGMLRIEGLPVALDDIDLILDVGDGEIRILRASAKVGNTGRVSASGSLPLRGLDLAGADAAIVATDVKVPLADGIRLTADARLRVRYEPPSRLEERSLPQVSGTVTLKRFAYTRPMAFRLDLDTITGRGRTEVETYDPENDTLAFDVMIVSPQPVRISNNLLDMHLAVEGSGLRVSGTDQRFGAQGTLAIEQNSKLFLQGHDFSVRDGKVVFENPTRIAPRLDLNATTEYRRYATVSDTTTSTSDVAGSTAGGRWRILMHAYGDLDAPEVRFSSDPPLSQEDIVLLLQVGMTRAELDRGLAGSLAQTVGLEALSAVIGLDQAVRKTVPIIDEFRFGSQYSSRTGRPEPTVTLGKRITDDVRATVTSTVGEEREIRSNVEWRLKGGVSVHGGYDNVNDVSSSVLGNVGAGLRWRLEFE